MIPFHALCPELAAKEVRCLKVIKGPESEPDSGLPEDEYAFLEFYCDQPKCDCRRVFIQVVAKNQRGKVFASINYGWEKESFYRKRTPWGPEQAIGTVRGELDPLNEQSEFAEYFLELFQKTVCDEPYRLRLQRHYEAFRHELALRT